MKVLAINGSPRKGGNTHQAIECVAAELEAQGVQVEEFSLAGRQIQACVGCNGCARNRDGRCVLADDGVNECMEKMRQADGILLASPVYFGEPAPGLRCLLDRAFYACQNSGNQLRYKVGGALVVLRRPGGRTALDTLQRYFQCSEMFISTATRWTICFGLKPGEILQDGEGLQSLRELGRNMAWLLQAVELGRAAHPIPPLERRIYTNMIRE
jgi:multimeric flavodoxin WrbA